MLRDNSLIRKYSWIIGISIVFTLVVLELLTDCDFALVDFVIAASSRDAIFFLSRALSYFGSSPAVPFGNKGPLKIDFFGFIFDLPQSEKRLSGIYVFKSPYSLQQHLNLALCQI